MNINKLPRFKINNAPVDASEFDRPIFTRENIARPIDYDVPRPNAYFNIGAPGKTIESDDIPIIDLKRATKPPVSELYEKRHEELCFPTLFPYGKYGVNEPRVHKMSILEYFQYRVMGSDPRFRSKEYLLYALNMVENERVRSSISICGKVRQNNQNVENLVSNLHLVMRAVRGSSAYWKTALTELIAMIKVLGPGHIFLTLSCNDLGWDFVHKMCLIEENRKDVDPSTLTLQEKQHLIESHPVLVSRIFNREVQNLIRLLKNGSVLKGNKIEDYWYRIEWQQRGSPHCHMIMWLKDFPEQLNSPEGIKMMDLLCRCDIPEDNPELAEMVMKYQRHKHSKKTCYKGNRGTCRFGFPRAVCSKTTVLDLDSPELLRNGYRIVQMKRPKNATDVNNYSEDILFVWRGNIDFQFVTSPGLVAYVAKYIGKSDQEELNTGIRDAINDAKASSDAMKLKLFKCSMKTLSEREVSCPESASRLCHLRMRGSSRDCVFINTSFPEERYRMLKVEQKNPADNSYFFNNIERYYNRPDELEHLSCAEFLCLYRNYYKEVDEQQNEEDGDNEFAEDPSDDIGELEAGGMFKRPKLPIIRLKNKMGMMQKRGRPGIFRSRYFSPIGDRIHYFYSLLVLHLPAKSASDIMQKLNSDESYDREDMEQVFLDKSHLLRPLDNSRSFEEYRHFADEIHNAIAQIRAMQNPDICGGNNDDDLVPHADYPVDVEQNVDIPEDPELLEPPEPKKLNGDQSKLYKVVRQIINEEFQNKSPPQLRVFTTGSAGTGKSFLIQQIVRLVSTAYRPAYPNDKVIFLTAPTGVAAKLIKGQTIHSALAMGIEHGKISEYRPLSGAYLENKRKEWKNTKFLIIDEISMVSEEMMRNIERRLRQLKDNNELFGGIHILVFGDLMQLPPVNGKPIYRPPGNDAVLHLWRLFDFCELKQNMRQKNDQPFIDLLNALRVGEMTAQHRKLLSTRVENEKKGVTREGIFANENATLIAPVLSIVNDHNVRVLSKMTTLTAKNTNPPKEYTFVAQDFLVDNTKGVAKPDIDKIIPDNINSCAGVPKELVVCIGARVMLRRNISTRDGLVNGALGTVVGFKWTLFKKDQLEEGELPESVQVNFDGIGMRNITPMCCTFNAKKGYGKIERRQVPLILAWAVTAHKLQGVTVENAVLDLGSSLFAKGQPYVMLSRAKSLDKILILRQFAVQKLSELVNKEAVKEMNRLQRLPQINVEDLVKTRDLQNSMRID